MTNDSALPPGRSATPVRFFGLVFVLGIPFWLLDSVPGVHLPATLPLSALQFICPLVAALICVRHAPATGVRSLLRRAVDHTTIRRTLWYVPILLTMPAIHLLAYGLMRLTGQPMPEPHLSVVALLASCVVYFISALCEEIGWTGYATDFAQQRWGPLPASLLIGVVWATVHVLPWLHVREPGWVVWQFVFTVAARVLLVSLHNNTGRSPFAVILCHTSINVSYTLFPDGGSHYDPAFVAPLTILAAILLPLLWRPAKPDEAFVHR